MKEAAAAREEYKDAVARRQTAVLLQETKADIFEVRVGRLAPGTSADISLTYITELPLEAASTKLTVPTTVAPRYVPAQDRSQAAATIASIPHCARAPARMTMSLDILMQTEIAAVTSPSHQISVTKREKAGVSGEYFLSSVKFEADTEAMDRDLVVLIESASPHQPQVLVEKDEDGSHVAMLSFVPSFQLRDHRVEAIFLVDCSGSMGGDSIQLAKEAMLVFLRSLPVTSYFNIYIFGSTFKSLFPESRAYDDHTFSEAETSIKGISANMGGTEILAPLQHIFKQSVKAGLARQVFVLTDGQVSNTAACVQLARSSAATNRVFTVGVGPAADRQLVKGVARAGLGTAVFTARGEAIAPRVVAQLRSALQPCVTEVGVRWGRGAQFEGAGGLEVELETQKTLFGFGKPKKKTSFSIKNMVPSKVPPIYDGNRLVVYKLLDRNFDIGEVVTVKARTEEGELLTTFKVTADSYIEGRSLHQLCARKLIQEVEEAGEGRGEDGRPLVTELGLKYGLASAFTSFVGVDEVPGSCGVMVTRRVASATPAGMLASNFCIPQASAPIFKGFGFGSMPLGAAPDCGPPPGAAPPVFGGEGGGGLFGAALACAAPPPPAAGFGGTLFFGDSGVNMTGRGRGGKGLGKGGAKRAAGFGGGASFFGDSDSDGTEEDGFGGGVLFGDDSEEEEEDETMRSHSINNNNDKEDQKPDSLKLTLTQNPSGSFPVTEEVAGIIGVSLEDLLVPSTATATDPRAWVTLVCLSFLTLHCREDRDTWELVADKARTWLASTFPQLNTDASAAAAEFVRQHAVTRSCGRGHRLYRVREAERLTSGPWHCDAGAACVGGRGEDGAHAEVSVWRCRQDWRVVSGGSCDYDLCGDCALSK